MGLKIRQEFQATYSLDLIERHHENSAVVEGGQSEFKESNR